MSHDKPFTLFSHVTGCNPWKVEMLLNELGLSANNVYVDTAAGEHKSAEFTSKYNPNGRIPVFVDHSNNDFVIWESDAILLYIIEKYDTERKFTFDKFEDRMLVNQWLIFQASGQGAYFGQAGFFKIVGGEMYRIPLAIERYQKEILRVFGVLESVLSKQEWLVGEKYSVADLSFVVWNEMAIMYLVNDYNGFNFEKDFPSVYRWHRAMVTRPAIVSALALRSSLAPKSIFIVAGIGNGTGTGGYTAREFAKLGYVIGLISSNEQHLQALVSEIKSAGGEAAYYAVSAYDYDVMKPGFEFFKKEFPNDEIRGALWNVTQATRKPFLEMKREDIQRMSDADVIGGLAFSQEAIKAFKDLTPNEHGKRGFLGFTSATGARRGAPNCTVSATGKFALRALSQSLAKEFKGEDIHVSHVIVDGMILTERWKVQFGDEWYAEKTKDETHRLNPESIAKAFAYLSQQDRSAWTWELDLRPSHENWTW